MWPSADALPLTAPQRNALRRLVRGRNTTQKMALRAGIVLRSQGLANHAIGCELGVNRKTVILWRKESGLDGLCDQTRPGRKPALSAEFNRYNASREAPSGHPLEHPHPRQALGRLQDGHPARLESARTTAPSPRNFQAQPRQAVRREASRRGRSILESARARAGAQRR